MKRFGDPLSRWNTGLESSARVALDDKKVLLTMVVDGKTSDHR